MKALRGKYLSHKIKSLAIIGLIPLCLMENLLATPLENNTSLLETEKIVSTFTDKGKAEKQLQALIKRGQNARILTQSKEVNLKSISIGLYSNQKKAQSIVKHLTSNNIDAFPYRLKSGRYRIHAGAMQHEAHYWSRFEKLLSLGYKRIYTTIKPITITTFFVISDSPAPLQQVMLSTPPIIEKRQYTFSNTFLSGRFKGEIYTWDESGQQSSSNYFSASLSARAAYTKEWDMTYGFRVDALEQSSVINIQQYGMQLLPTYLRLRQTNSQAHIGLIDGRWDERKHASLSDRLSSKILTRYLLDDEIIDRRRPIIGARWQLSQSEYRLDIIANPIFRPAKLPHDSSIWHPVDRTNGTILGIRPTANWQELVKKGSFADEQYQTGGIGIRMSQQIGQRIRATTVQYVRRSAPYYELNTDIQKRIAAGTSVDAALATATNRTFTPRHPYSAIFTWEESGDTSHFELAVSSSTPYTTSTYQMKTAVSLEWVLGFTYPIKNNKTYFSSHFIGRWINTRDDILDRKIKTGLKGEFYQKLASRHWKAGTAYQVDFDQFGLFLSPKISYEQSKYLTISLYYQFFAGSDNTNNGYYRDNSAIGLNWQAAF